MKTTKSVITRFKMTGSGKVLRRKIGQRHHKNAKRRTNIHRGKKNIPVTGPTLKKVRTLMLAKILRPWQE